MATAQSSEQDITDQEVFELLKASSPDAAARLIEVFGDRVYGLCLRILSSEEDAKEAVQETFLTVWRKWETFKAKSRFSSWIYRIAANFAYMRLRKQKRRANEISLDVFETSDHLEHDLLDGRADAPPWHKRSPTPDEAMVKVEFYEALQESVASLSPTYRTAYMLKDIDGLSLEEIADVMKLSLPAVKSRVHRARLLIRKKLAPIIDRN